MDPVWMLWAFDGVIVVSSAAALTWLSSIARRLNRLAERVAYLEAWLDKARDND